MGWQMGLAAVLARETRFRPGPYQRWIHRTSCFNAWHGAIDAGCMPRLTPQTGRDSRRPRNRVILPHGSSAGRVRWNHRLQWLLERRRVSRPFALRQAGGSEGAAGIRRRAEAVVRPGPARRRPVRRRRRVHRGAARGRAGRDRAPCGTTGRGASARGSRAAW